MTETKDESVVTDNTMTSYFLFEFPNFYVTNEAVCDIIKQYKRK